MVKSTSEHGYTMVISTTGEHGYSYYGYIYK